MRLGSSANARNLNGRNDGYDKTRRLRITPTANLLSHAVRAGPARVREQWSPISTTSGRWRACDSVSTEANDDGVAKSASTVGFVPKRGSSAASLI
jgi:hypothetical protein